MTILITGGAGYIGSHTALELLNDWEDMAAEEPDGYAGRRAALQAGYDAERRGL